MIVVTGAAGFIGSVLVGQLNAAGYRDLALVDDFGPPAKQPNWSGKQYATTVHREALLPWLQTQPSLIEAVVHLGARTDTTETDGEIFRHLNLEYSQALWQWCTREQVPFIYASSAATYGDGSLGFDDDPALLARLQPLNAYARSKHAFDLWVQQQEEKPFFWAGLKFFNVYGPNEAHKGRMASVVWHAHRQITENGVLELFESHRPGVAHGQQQRDFVYVRDVCSALLFLLENRPASGLFNLGSGRARSFLDLGNAVFSALGREANIRFVPTPLSIRNSYQYYTCANMQRLKALGWQPQWELEQGVQEYVRDFLLPKRFA